MIEIFGDRQVGKTEMVMSSALLHAAEGKLVLWLAPLTVAAVDVLRRYQYWQWDHPLAALIKRVYTGNGNEHVLTNSGGRIVFRSVNTSGRGVLPDVIVCDDVEFTPAVLSALTPAMSRAEKMYVLTCSGELPGGD
ncbi:Uncharacterised protein [Mycobacteroides abscessus subsp. abscessus]|nr:Uncharacterised protein [Mycobacteroides abscessus subsp. abscessus]